MVNWYRIVVRNDDDPDGSDTFYAVEAFTAADALTQIGVKLRGSRERVVAVRPMIPMPGPKDVVL